MAPGALLKYAAQEYNVSYRLLSRTARFQSLDYCIVNLWYEQDVCDQKVMLKPAVLINMLVQTKMWQEIALEVWARHVLVYQQHRQKVMAQEP